MFIAVILHWKSC